MNVFMLMQNRGFIYNYLAMKRFIFYFSRQRVNRGQIKMTLNELLDEFRVRFEANPQLPVRAVVETEARVEGHLDYAIRRLVSSHYVLEQQGQLLCTDPHHYVGGLQIRTRHHNNQGAETYAATLKAPLTGIVPSPEIVPYAEFTIPLQKEEYEQLAELFPYVTVVDGRRTLIGCYNGNIERPDFTVSLDTIDSLGGRRYTEIEKTTPIVTVSTAKDMLDLKVFPMLCETNPETRTQQLVDGLGINAGVVKTRASAVLDIMMQLGVPRDKLASQTYAEMQVNGHGPALYR
jgi:hypothetical protein